MVKKDLVDELWLKFPDFRKKDLEIVLDLFFERLAQALREEQRIEIRGFGRFLVKTQKSRLFRNPKTGEVRQIPERKRIVFKVGKDLKERLNQEALASLDLGTQTFRLLVAKPEQAHLRVLFRKRINVRLGADLAQTGRISPEAFARGLEALKTFKKHLEQMEVSRFIAAGTAVFRQAANAKEFIEAARKLGIEIQVLSPEEEAKLTAQGVLAGLKEAKKDLVIVDVGGGSTEFIFCPSPGEVVSVQSLNLGSVVFTKAYLRHEIPKSFEISTCEEKISATLKDLKIPFKPSKIIATGGTASCLVALHLGLEHYHPALIHGKTLTLDDLEDLFHRLRKMPLEERRALKGMEPGREDIILAGLLFFILILRHFNLYELRVSETGILEGLVLHLQASNPNI